MADLLPNTVRKAQIAARLLKQLTETNGGISPTLEGVWLVVLKQAQIFLNEAANEAQQAFDAG